MPQNSKNMKTNQMMNVEIGKFGTIKIGHKTEMGDVSQVIDMGNSKREKKGLRTIELREILAKQEFWEFVVARNTLDFKYPDSGVFTNSGFIDVSSDMSLGDNIDISSNFKELEKYKNLFGKIEYSELMKKFPHLIKSKRGRNGGTFAELYILLKIASMLDKDLEVAIYDVFIKSQILQHRDNGGDNFKKLNIAIDKYIPSKSGNSRSQFMHIAKMLRVKLEITETKGYNEKEHHSKVQQKRDEIERFLIMSLQSKTIISYKHLKTIVENLEVF